MEEEILMIDGKTRVVKALGLELDVKLEELKILVNGVDIKKNIVLESLKIVKEAKD